VGSKTGLPAYFTHCPEAAYADGNSDSAGTRIIRIRIDAVLATKTKTLPE
jgi:hypothetical protein